MTLEEEQKLADELAALEERVDRLDRPYKEAVILKGKRDDTCLNCLQRPLQVQNFPVQSRVLLLQGVPDGSLEGWAQN